MAPKLSRLKAESEAIPLCMQTARSNKKFCGTLKIKMHFVNL